MHKLWIAFAKFYEDNEQIDDARTIFEKAAKVQFRTVDDLAAIWCEYAEMELRQENYDGALRIGFFSFFEFAEFSAQGLKIPKKTYEAIHWLAPKTRKLL